MKFSFLLVSLLTVTFCYAQSNHPEVTELSTNVPIVDPMGQNGAPSDAIVLFDGSSQAAWTKARFGSAAETSAYREIMKSYDAEYIPEPAAWLVVDGELEVVPGQGDIMTKQSFGDVQLHIEWMSPVDEGKAGQGYSNSGVFLMGIYEVQVLNSHANSTYSNGQAGSIYKQAPPLVNASRPAGEWQVYDIIFRAPYFNDHGRVASPATITVLHNGVLIQNNVQLRGPTAYIGNSDYIPHPEKLPIRLQDHSDKVRFRNIWVREL